MNALLTRLAVTATSLLAVILTTGLTGCGGDEGNAGPEGGGGGDASAPLDAGPRQAPQRPAASCSVVIEAPAFLPAPHVPEGTVVQYNSNPPSSGPHYPVWAHFQEYSKPVDAPYLVHSLEHGAVLLLYKCTEPSGCPAVVEALRRIRDGAATDPDCDPSVRVRVVIAPDPKLDVPVAAAAWGYTYKADCVDAPTLSTFLRDHYAQGPENICASGRTF